jgi:hypothetical protein
MALDPVVYLERRERERERERERVPFSHMLARRDGRVLLKNSSKIVCQKNDRCDKVYYCVLRDTVCDL